LLLWANLTRIWVCVIGWPRSETRCAESANLSPFPACRSPPLPSLCQYQNPLSIRCLRNMETGKLDRRQTFGAEQGFPALLRKMICQGVEERLIGILGSLWCVSCVFTSSTSVHQSPSPCTNPCVDTSHTLDCCCAHSTSLNKKRFSGFSKQLSSFTRRSYYTTHNARDRECCPGCAQSCCPRSSLVCVQQSPSKFEEFLYSRRSTAET